MSEYLIPDGIANGEYEVKRSRFLAEVRPITSMEQMKEFIKEKRELHPKANHNCWALIGGSPNDSNSYGFSDDGEPNGCAGKPMFTVLQYSGAGQIGLVVTRYFGGIKLGTGGMVKAYTEAAKVGLEVSNLIPFSPTKTVKITMPYDQEPHLRYLFEQVSLEGEFQYGATVVVTVQLRDDAQEYVLKLLRESLSQDVVIEM